MLWCDFYEVLVVDNDKEKWGKRISLNKVFNIILIEFFEFGY